MKTQAQIAATTTFTPALMVSCSGNEAGYVPLASFLTPPVPVVETKPKGWRSAEVKARSFLKSLGVRVALGFLRNRGFTERHALSILGIPTLH